MNEDFFQQQNLNLFGVILAGGSGTRFWPKSRQTRPKQLCCLGDKDETMIELTIQRMRKIVPDEKKSGDEESLIVNSCPEGNAYVGNGLCRKVECIYPMDHFKAAKGHNQIVAGKSDWSCKNNIFFIPAQCKDG